MLVSLSGVGVSFFLTQKVNEQLSEVNLRSVPFQRELTQLASDTDLLKREMERSLGYAYWQDPRWKPKRIPVWAFGIHRATLERIPKDFLKKGQWQDWYDRVSRLNSDLVARAEALYVHLQAQQFDQAADLYPEWIKRIEILKKETDWAKREIDQETRLAFKAAQQDVQSLRTALQFLLLVVIGVALLMVWMGERALRPIGHLRTIVQHITKSGSMTNQAKSEIPVVLPNQRDEVSELAREFHQMATSLLEREKMIESQKERLEEQNKRLQQMGVLQKRLQEAEHLAGVGRLSAQVAHEVGNPLHSIGLEAELALELSQTLLPTASAKSIHLRQSLQSILSSVERLQKIIQNYLRLSKMSTVQAKPVDLSEVIESTLALYANSLAKMGIQMDWHLSGRPEDRVLADPDLLENALGNLLRNSIQALEDTPEKSRKISIRVGAPEAGRIFFEYSDNGNGMGPEVAAQVFKPFFSTKAQGTGLGLSFVKKVFTDFGGDFRLKSTAPGGGVFFEGWLKVAEKNSQAQLNHQGQFENRSGSDENITR